MAEKKISFLKSFIKFIILCGSALFAGGIYYLYIVSQSLPSYESLTSYNPDQASYIYDSNGEIMGEIANQKRIFVSIDEIPQKLKNAFIAAEDKTFYENQGVNILGFIRAVIKNIIITIREPGTRYTGASTITQQVVRNLLLSNERTVTRKAKEMILAYQISQHLSKDKILEIYLNHIYLGSRSYGVAAAAKEYFDKKISDLTVAESALLASLPKAPSAIDPNKSIIRATERRNYILYRMMEEKYITEEEYQEAKTQNIVIARQKSKYVGDSFIDYVRQVMYQNDISEEELLTRGYKINTTMRKKWQQIAQNAINEGVIKLDRKLSGYRGAIANIDTAEWLKNLKNVPLPLKIGDYKLAVVLKMEKNTAFIGLADGTDGTIELKGFRWAISELLKTENEKIFNYKIDTLFKIGDVIAVSNDGEKHYNLEQIPEIDGAVVIMSPISGEIYAIVGGYSDIRGSFNRAFQAKRQAGSTAKLYVYLAALEAGISPAEIFMDSEISYNMGYGKVWSPRNWSRDYRGPVTMRTGFESSINTITLRLAEKIGIKKVMQMMKKMGFTKEEIEPNYGICLGTTNTTLLDITTSFGIIANYGNKVVPQAISKIELANKNIYLKNSEGNPVDDKLEEMDELDLDEAMNLEEEQKYNKIINEAVAYQMISLLTGAVQRGTGGSLKDLDIPIGAKTGTSQGGQSLWAMGFTPDVVIGVYMGYDIPKDTNLFAASTTMPVLANIFKEIKPNLSKAIFRIPEGITMVKINKNTGRKSNNHDANIIFEAFKNGDNIEEESTIKSVTNKTNSVNQGDFSGIY